MYRSPVDLYGDQWVYELLETIERTGARRVLIDSLTNVEYATGDAIRFSEYVYSLTLRCSRAGVSLLMDDGGARAVYHDNALQLGHLSALLEHPPARVRAGAFRAHTRGGRVEDSFERPRPAHPRIRDHTGRNPSQRAARRICGRARIDRTHTAGYLEVSGSMEPLDGRATPAPWPRSARLRPQSLLTPLIAPQRRAGALGTRKSPRGVFTTRSSRT
jgi:hypothetical protein